MLPTHSTLLLRIIPVFTYSFVSSATLVSHTLLILVMELVAYL